MSIVKIEFEKGEGVYLYKDCINLTQEEYDSLTPEDIENIKEQRYQNWRYIIDNPKEFEIVFDTEDSQAQDPEKSKQE